MSESYFGACPVCEQSDGYMNVGRHHYFVCHTHRKKWCAGSNLLSGWREEPASVHEENAAQLEAYEKVEPIYPDPSKPRPKVRPPKIEVTCEEGDQALRTSARMVLNEAYENSEALNEIISCALRCLAQPTVRIRDVNLRVEAHVESIRSALQTAMTLLHHADPELPC